jgi:nickel-type superoxide dismutase maturation protease
VRVQPVYTRGMPRLPPFPLARFVVADTSMQPALRPGDRVLVLRWFSPRARDIVVLRDPENPRRLLIKRLEQRTAQGGYVVLADNPNVSRDSRVFGAVKREALVGKVVWRYGKR